MFFEELDEAAKQQEKTANYLSNNDPTPPRPDDAPLAIWLSFARQVTHWNKELGLKEGAVTDTRYSASKISHTRNDGSLDRSLEAGSCHWCRASWHPGQMRYPLMTFCVSGWKLASFCKECFGIEGIDAGDSRNNEIRTPVRRLRRTDNDTVA
jgi:hypothetical protein